MGGIEPRGIQPAAVYYDAVVAQTAGVHPGGHGLAPHSEGLAQVYGPVALSRRVGDPGRVPVDARVA